MKRRAGPKGLRGALLTSGVLHAAVVGVFWASSLGAPAPTMRVYAVDIVSPPPQQEGPPTPPAQEPTPEPTAEPATEPTPPAPEPQPRPTPQAPRPQPQPPAPTPQPAPRPAERPRPEPPRQTPPQPAPQRPAPPQPAPTPPRAEPRPPAPSTGSNPSPASAGGDGVNVRTEGLRCPSEEYCNNIARQVQRYFRRPAQSQTDRGDVCFALDRRGAAHDVEVQRLQGGFAFRLALMEAVEQASRNDAFGPLPRGFTADRLPVCIGMSPQS